jgi:hypothetical protein
MMPPGAMRIGQEVHHGAYSGEAGVPGAIAGKFTVSEIAEKFLMRVASIFISKSKVFKAYYGM